MRDYSLFDPLLILIIVQLTCHHFVISSPRFFAGPFQLRLALFVSKFAYGSLAELV